MTIAGHAAAHEFWIEPEKHYTEDAARIDVVLRVGQNFRGSTQPYVPDKFVRFEHLSTTTESVAGMLGDSRPAATVLTRPGLNRLVHLSTPFFIRYRVEDERWDKYVAQDGLDRQLRQFPGVSRSPPLKERYVRSAKSLIVTGADPVTDSLTGRLPFELVVDGSWNRLPAGEHRFTLYEGERGLGGILVKAFRQSDRAVVDEAYSDADGRVRLTLPTADRYLVSGVVIRADSDPQADWISHWPSLTLEVLSAGTATFEERVDRANAAFETEQGEAWEKKLGPHIQRAIRQCAPGGSAGKGPAGKFVLAADVSAEGQLLDALVRPETRASICFVDALGAQTLPAPPGSLLREGIAPLSVEIFIVP